MGHLQTLRPSATLYLHVLPKTVMLLEVPVCTNMRQFVESTYWYVLKRLFIQVTYQLLPVRTAINHVYRIPGGQYGGQGSTDPLVPGWQLNPYHLTT
jgi:hypothetical protein